MLGVARQVVGRELGRLRKQAADLERDISRGPIGMHGQIVPGLAERIQQARLALVAIQDEIRRIGALDDEGIRKLAFELGAR